MGKFIVSIGKFICAWSIPVCDDSAWANCLSALASYLSMGKFTFAWSTDTDTLAHGQIQFCAQTFFCIVNNNHTECACKNENAHYGGGIPK